MAPPMSQCVDSYSVVCCSVFLTRGSCESFTILSCQQFSGIGNFVCRLFLLLFVFYIGVVSCVGVSAVGLVDVRSL